jgi:hypothetical protein
VLEYHFYKIAKNGHVQGEPLLEHAATDMAAIAKARQLVDGVDIEIWEGPRLVAYVVPETPTDGT